VDEQQRFGVKQRRAILDKAAVPDLLLMTATPIPRSLALTAFGDFDLSIIRHPPPGRMPVKTHLTREGNEQRVYERVAREIEAGRQAYFVYPQIEREDGPTKSVEMMYRRLSKSIYPDRRTALIHSRIDERLKRERMESFNRGDVDILLATSVVEVGVDVPNASCMVIEGAERFGLSTLHQLRGRVGRGPYQSYAFLIYGHRLTQSGVQRLRIMKETADGFRIAEEDLKIRGPGELLGLRQSGLPDLRISDLSRDLSVIRDVAEDLADLQRRGIESDRRRTRFDSRSGRNGG
jgi:ATP-dependent DNA helicase RecG